MNLREYDIAFARAAELVKADPPLDTPEGRELAQLSAELDAFERVRWPLGPEQSAARTAIERTLRFVGELSEFYRTADLLVWFNTEQPLLDGQRPAEMLITDEGTAELSAMVERLRSGAYV